VRLFVAVTDYDWFQVHAVQPSVEEVNFWQPSPDSVFRALSPGCSNSILLVTLLLEAASLRDSFSCHSA
jgi:hypothetical protein